jgi:lysyl-tRNA synthetase class 2
MAGQQLDEILRIRREKAEKLASLGWAPFPNGISVTHTAAEVRSAPGTPVQGDPAPTDPTFRVAGRIKRLQHGKMSWIDIYDRSGKIQVQARKDLIGEDTFQKIGLLDRGDFIVVQGPRFLTRQGELTIQAREVQLVTKSMYPLPDTTGQYGFENVDLRYRQRYVDLVVNNESREVFLRRTRLIRFIRRFLDQKDFLEVETPMLHSLVSGAAAKPFTTHHNALDMDLYCRIAPELHLKRLLVGGFERVYEIGRNFRNEGLSTQHNPEFTMLEFYWAYQTYQGLMEVTEEMFRGAAQEVAGTLQIEHGGWEGTPKTVIDFGKPFRRIPVRDGVLAKIPGLDLSDAQAIASAAKAHHLELDPKLPAGKLVMDLFEHLHQEELVQPTFVVDFPIEVSPLARRKNGDPTLADRFELYITGREIANAFSELNDPDDQRSRFQAQVEAKKRGAEETMDYDEDYCHALEVGMPPAAGEGVGIDRLIMILTNAPSIRDVILFPQMRRS